MLVLFSPPQDKPRIRISVTPPPPPLIVELIVPLPILSMIGLVYEDDSIEGTAVELWLLRQRHLCSIVIRK